MDCTTYINPGAGDGRLALAIRQVRLKAESCVYKGD